MKRDRKTCHRRRYRSGWSAAQYAVLTLALTAVFLVLTQAVVINARVSSQSMEKTIRPADRLIGSRIAYWCSPPKRYDIIIFYFPDDETQRFIKRVIGLPGETVEIRDGKVYINDSDSPLADDFCPDVPKGNYGPYRVPQDSYFVLGDNREISRDSRYWKNPFVKTEKIIGKALFRYWPLKRMGWLK